MGSKIQRYDSTLEHSTNGAWMRYEQFERRERELLGLLRGWRELVGVTFPNKQAVLIKRTDLALAEREGEGK